MAVIKGVLKEELANSLRMQRSYDRELSKLPKGTLVKKLIKGRPYYYFAFREGEKVRFIYKGKLSSASIEKYKKAAEYRAKYRKLLSRVRKQVKFLRSRLRGKEPV
ncbi:MAG: hypothetical protein ACREH5_03985 [Candidatus Omnitrophota bacterium]